jgi:hypothetical protein
MIDPFERSKAIRNGELDSEMPMYEELTGWLGRVPLTWLPGLLIRIVKECIVKNVFANKDAMIRVVEKAAKDATDLLSMLRVQPHPDQPKSEGKIVDQSHKCGMPGCETRISDGAPELCPDHQTMTDL